MLQQYQAFSTAKESGVSLMANETEEFYMNMILTASLAFYQMVQFGTVQYQMEWSMKVNGKTYECTPIGWVANPYYSISDRVVA